MKVETRTIYVPEIGDRVKVPDLLDQFDRVWLKAGEGVIKSVPEDSMHRFGIEIHGKTEWLLKYDFDLIIDP
ncbi:hypothetical protein [Mesorhizobium sp. M1B.F.Ca.ET.045.04.1.1]|uniref:hypothetical protein n=1 Tax=Mesorhizobium sp. M1B.F.Ca.ET.045.04.1.1 TaxID=2493673 RepID=UPI000F75FD81|nr:hypothetical protein [Mesorhizobium sp. M1B.F.Ca.ET.045.04.1.1]AZO29410.1 hypothetical protein EJ071_19795 [Mesorhizobium sp. M1B.F.Ca.ET.045.04.1.1]